MKFPPIRIHQHHRIPGTIHKCTHAGVFIRKWIYTQPYSNFWSVIPCTIIVKPSLFIKFFAVKTVWRVPMATLFGKEFTGGEVVDMVEFVHFLNIIFLFCYVFLKILFQFHPLALLQMV